MKRLIVILLLSIFPIIAFTQSQVLRGWESGPLSWNDFQGEVATSSAPSLLRVTLDVTSKEVEKDNQLYYEVVATALMDCNSSYVLQSAKNEQRLKYHQLQFDLLELYRRRLQQELVSGDKSSVAKKLERYRTQYAEQINKIKQETSDGKEVDEVQELIYDTRMRLSHIGEPRAVVYTPSDWCYGFYLGVGAIFPTSQIKKYFGGNASFTAGLMCGYKRLNLSADITYGQAGFNTKNVFGQVDDKGRALQGPMNEYATHLNIGASLGYSVLRTNKFSITPKVGAIWGGYSWNMANLEYVLDEQSNKEVSKIINTESAKLNDWNWRAGIDFDVKIHRNVSSPSFFLSGKKEQYTSVLRFTPFISYAKYDLVGAKGCNYGFTISYSGIARTLKVK